MNPIIISFLLGLNPSIENNPSLGMQWEELSTEERSMIVRQFEREYKIKLNDLTNDDLENMQRDLVLRSWDLQE